MININEWIIYLFLLVTKEYSSQLPSILDPLKILKLSLQN